VRIFCNDSACKAALLRSHLERLRHADHRNDSLALTRLARADCHVSVAPGPVVNGCCLYENEEDCLMLEAPPALEIRNLHKRYGDLEVLKGISLAAHDGAVISILGSSGSGKSTFLRCINLLETPHQGQILVAGEELRLKPLKNGELTAAHSHQITRLRSKIGFVFQNFNLWPHMSVLDNITEAPRRVLGKSKAEANEIAEALLAKVGIAEKRHAYPNQLSGGQQQRAAIARTLAMQPKVILFDEPTSALDPEMVQEVLNVIRTLAEEGRTMLLVTHELNFARQVSSEVLFLHQGLVEEQGPPEQVFENPHSLRCKQFMSSHR
jgi:ABC-type histidine transport system ATPase subunit